MGLHGQDAGLDAGDAIDNQLLGKGRAVRNRERHDVMAAVHSFKDKEKLEGWVRSDVTVRCRTVTEHKHADIPGIGSVACATYGRARTRVSYFVLYWSGATEKVGKIQRFVLVSKAGLQPLRLAVGLAYAQRPPLGGGRVYTYVCGEHHSAPK